MSLREVARYAIKKDRPEHTFHLIISQGSVLDFEHPNGAIVNAANQGCIIGGGVDGAISKAGGSALQASRRALPVLHTDIDGFKVRCFTGDAKITGPSSDYGSIKTPFVIHAVGPAFREYCDLKEADGLLKSAYQQSLERARETELEAVAFSLLSSGVYRGPRSLKSVLKTGVTAIMGFKGYPKLNSVHMCAYSPVELITLLNAVEDLELEQLNEES